VNPDLKCASFKQATSKTLFISNDFLFWCSAIMLCAITANARSEFTLPPMKLLILRTNRYFGS
jgi:hypothetical protein